MYFSASTVALVATLGLIGTTEASPLTERGNSLCNKPNYGAQGKPWQSTSTPGSFCSSKKPNNSKQWSTIPYWDGGDAVKCNSWLSAWGVKVCNGGNKPTKLPSGCKPPMWGWRGGKKITSIAPGPTSTAKATTTAAATTVITTASPAVPTTAPAASTTDAGSTDAASTDSAPAASSTGLVGGVVDGTTGAVGNAPDLNNPVCELTYQATYLNYTLVVPNGVWTGMTMGAAAQDGSYMTYTLSTSIDDCLRACDQIEGCQFVNTYYDVNETEEDLPKHTPGVLTCAMFSSCVPTSQNNNWGGQDDPNSIVQSNGYCKSGLCNGTS